MPPIINRPSLKNAFLGSLIVTGLSTTSYAEDEEDSQSVTSTNSKSEAYTVMDVAAMIAYQDKRHAKLEKSLSLSNLSNEHQELLSSVMAKVFLGVPVSTFTENNR